MEKSRQVKTAGERRGNVTYEENPYMPNLAINHKKVINKRGDMILVKADTGEIQSQVAGFWEAQEVDSTQFVKLFAAGMKKLKDLKSPGVKVLEILYLIVKENKDKDRIFMNFRNVDQIITPMSLATFTRGVKELVDCEFIAPSPDVSWFWINPTCFFNGDRLTFAKTYYLKDTAPPLKELEPKPAELSPAKPKATRKKKGEKTDA
ncbi:MAG: replication protein [Hydrococcus sp. SU_1_0]|nr:replication protein [Hydrococcus sp. SU_1_0]